MINELKRRRVPNFLVKDGREIASVKEWEEIKPLVKELFLKEEYGYLPNKLVPSVKTEKCGIDFAGKAEWESVYFTLENEGKSHTVKTELILPKGKENVPVFLSLNFAKEVPNKYLPVEEIIDTGFGVLAFCYEDVTRDNGDFTDGLAGLFERTDKNSFAKISLWAYFASICMDYLLTRKEVDKESIAIIGHSRLGKTALLCSALDGRFKLTCVNDSGCCGAALTRGKTEKNETLEKITEVFPFWFCEEFKKYVGKEEELPFDQHMLLALVAPRYLIVGGAKEDIWADNVGQRLSCALSAPVWELYEKGLSNTRVNYYEREGTHFLSRTDWIIYMDGFKKILDKEKDTK